MQLASERCNHAFRRRLRNVAESDSGTNCLLLACPFLRGYSKMPASSHGRSPCTLSAAAPSAEELNSKHESNRRNVGCGFLFSALEADVPTRSANSSFSGRITDCNRSGFGLNGSHQSLARLYCTNSKD